MNHSSRVLAETQANSHADPDGDFVEALGRNFTAEQASKIMIDHIKDWEGKLDRSPRQVLDA